MAVGRYQWASNGRGQMRAADTDRDRAVAFLTTAFTEGRLTKDEYDARVETALSARTYSDLDMVVSDLPGARIIAPYPPHAPVRGTNGLAVASLACGLGQLILGPLATIPAIALGHMARHQIRRTGEEGAGMALAGLLLGWAAVAMAVFVVAMVAVAFGVSAHGVAVHSAVPGGPPAPPGPP